MKFFSKGDESPSLIERYTANIDRTKQEILDIESGIPEKRRQIENLALAAEDGDGNALSSIDKLYDDIEHDKRAIDRKNIVLIREQKLLSEETSRQQASDNRLAQKKMLDLLRKRETYAKEIERHARLLVENVAAIHEINRKAAGAWRSTWPGGFNALIGADESYARPSPGQVLAMHVQNGPGSIYRPSPGLAEFVRQTLGHLCAEYKVRIPEAAYRDIRDESFPGLTASYAAITNRVKKIFAEQSSQSPPAEQHDDQVSQAPTPVVNSKPTGRMTDQEILDNDKAGNPLNLPLSGREWSQISKYSENSGVIAEGTHFDPFDPSNI